jgi:hypothetical protein
VIVSVIGIDPGPTTGFCFLEYHRVAPGVFSLAERHLFQADGSSARILLNAMLIAYYEGEEVTGRYCGIEKFVTGRGAGTKGANADVTRRLVQDLRNFAEESGYYVSEHTASEAKTWATDKMLSAAGITGDSGIHGKLRDAYDSARHALFTARWDAYMPNPLA